jgi:hypothetical protein
MKKFVLLSLIALLIMGLAPAVYAQIDFKAFGSMTAGGVMSENFSGSTGPILSPWAWTPDGGQGFDRTQNFYSSYANIFFEFDAGKDIRGVFNIETCNYHSGSNTTMYPAIQGTEFDTGLWDTRVGETRLRNAYIQFGVPYIGIPVPMTISAGVIPMNVRPAFTFAATNGAGIQWDIKADPVAISFLWGKMVENQTWAADDSDFYSLEGKFNAGPATIGAYVIFNNMDGFPIVYTPAKSSYEAEFWWLGLYADGKAGPFNFNFDFAYDTGTIEARESALGPGVDDVDYSGWAIQGKLAYPSPWKWTFGFTGMYASGADTKKTSRNGRPGDPVAEPTSARITDKVGSFVVPAGGSQVPWAESMFLGGHFSTLICIPQQMAYASPWLTVPNRGAIGGTWIAKLFAAYPVTSAYKVTVWGMYIGDTTENGNTLGNALKSSGALRDDKGIGWEFALIQDISIYKNLMLTFGAGYLFAGDALDQYNATTGANKSPDNPWILDFKLAYNF